MNKVEVAKLARSLVLEEQMDPMEAVEVLTGQGATSLQAKLAVRAVVMQQVNTQQPKRSTTASTDSEPDRSVEMGRFIRGTGLVGVGIWMSMEMDGMYPFFIIAVGVIYLLVATLSNPWE